MERIKLYTEEKLMNLITSHSITATNFFLFHLYIVVAVAIFTLVLAITVLLIALFKRASTDRWVAFLLNVCRTTVVLVISFIGHVVVRAIATGGNI